MIVIICNSHYLRRAGRVVVGGSSVEFGFGYSPFYYSLFGYYPFGYDYNYNDYAGESKLNMQVDNIKADYRDKFKSAKQDTSISKDERKKSVKQLKLIVTAISMV